MNPNRKKALEAFGHLLDIMDELREKCPWDKKQTFDSLRYLTLEEVYELSDALIKHDLEEVKTELGDLLLHIAFYAKLGEEESAFSIENVITSLNEKLVRRHPHIYGNVSAETEDQVKQNWETIKLKEGKNKTVLGGVPQSMPALIKALRIQEKARGVGFDWENPGQVWEKVEEEKAEFLTHVDAGKGHIINMEEAEKEFGDYLFSMVNYARFIGINPENALEKTNEKFIRRFNYIEEGAHKTEKDIHQLSIGEMEKLWQEAKARGL